MKGANTRTLFADATSFHAVIHTQKEQRGNAPCQLWRTEAGASMLSYAETGRLVERLAYWFDSHHSRERIAVVGENSIQWVLSFYALVCSRNTVALPDPNLSAKDLSEILNRVHTTTVLLSPAYAHAEELKTLMPQAVFMPLTYDAVMQFAEQAEGENSDPSVHAPDDPAAIHFTSGTTGLPKCVLLTQDNLLACAQGTDSIYFYYETPRSMAMLPQFHTFGRIAMDYALMAGIEFCIFSNMKFAMQELTFFKPDIILSVPAVIPMLLEVPDLSFLKRMIIGGAASAPELLGKLREKCVIPINAYGLTETSPVLTGNLPWIQKDASVGVFPANGTWTVKIDENGEVCVRGRNVMAEYIGDEQATKEVIDPDGWLHTGDLGYIDEDGFLFLTGRCKNLICLSNGKNVSPEALEHKLSVIPEIVEVVVYAEDEKICAEIFAKGDEKSLRKAITGINRE